MLKPLGLTYKVEDEVLLITSPQAEGSETYPQTYYVGDLIMPPKSGTQDADRMPLPASSNGTPGQQATPPRRPMAQLGPMARRHQRRPRRPRRLVPKST